MIKITDFTYVQMQVYGHGWINDIVIYKALECIMCEQRQSDFTCIESFMCFYMFNSKTLSTVLNNQLCNKKKCWYFYFEANNADIINLYFLILNKRTLYFDQKNTVLNNRCNKK